MHSQNKNRNWKIGIQQAFVWKALQFHSKFIWFEKVFCHNTPSWILITISIHLSVALSVQLELWTRVSREATSAFSKNQYVRACRSRIFKSNIHSGTKFRIYFHSFFFTVRMNENFIFQIPKRLSNTGTKLLYFRWSSTWSFALHGGSTPVGVLAPCTV